jgi:methyl-accepting chemotaxis protein
MKWLTNLFGTIRGRLLFGTMGLALIPLIVAGAGLLTAASQAGRDALQARAADQLQSLRTVKSSEIGAYFGTLRKTMLVLSANPVVVGAMKDLDQAYPTAGVGLSVSPAEQRAAVTRYFTGDFAQEYAKRNHGEPSDMAPIVASLPDAAIALQYLFIARNPAPLGSKNQMDASPEDVSGYSAAHRALHPFMRQVYEQFGFYDFFLVDPDTGNIVYTFFKEADFTTSLLTGPYAKTKLGEAFAAARTATDPHFIYLSEFAPYLPSSAPRSSTATSASAC